MVPNKNYIVTNYNNINIYYNDTIIYTIPNNFCELNQFIKNNPKYTIEKYLDGIITYCLYHNNKWVILAEPHHNLNIDSIFNELFSDYNSLQKDFIYLFNLQHSELNLDDAPNLTLVIKYNIKEHVFSKPETIINLDITASIKEFCSINSNYCNKGILLRNKESWSIIYNPSYEFYKSLHNSYIKMVFNYCFLTKTEFIKKYTTNKYINIYKKLDDYIYTLYITYRNIFVKKIQKIDDVDDTIDTNIVLNLHHLYINQYLHRKEYISKSVVKEYILNKSPHSLFKIITKYPQNFNSINNILIKNNSQI
jgi:hypothetical protein